MKPGPLGDARLRVLELFNKYTAYGGEELVADRILEHLRTFADVASLRWDSNDWAGPDAPGKLTQLRKLFYNHDSAQQLRDAVADHRPDVVVCHNLYPIGSPSVYAAAAALGVPLLQFVHNFRPFSVSGTLWTGRRVAYEALAGRHAPEILAGAWQGSRLKSAAFSLMLKSAKRKGHFDAVTHWLTVSDFMRDTFVWAGLPEDRVTTLRNFWTLPPEDTDHPDQGYYLFLGRLVPEKGVDTLIEAWDRLHAQQPDTCPRLVLAGTGPLQNRVAAAAGRNPKIDHPGHVSGDTKRDLIRGCRAMLAPSVWWEPLGMVTYEAYEHAKPILAAASGGLPEIIQPGTTGLLHTPGDPQSLLASVQTLESMPPEARQTMGQYGRAWLRQHTSKQQWTRLFVEIADRARTRR
ncbi:MAG: glycosyltransferase family 4 protein [Planctomycetota bacterium]